MSVTALLPYFGSARMNAERIASFLDGCSWVGVPFAGGMTELMYLKARTLVVSDLNRLAINLARVVGDEQSRRDLVKLLNAAGFHPDSLADSQLICRCLDDGELKKPNVSLAAAYFICSWMSRSGICGTDGELRGSLSMRWNAAGGDSAKRFRSATRTLGDWGRVFKRATFHTLDCFEFLDKCKDVPETGIYCDPPFPDAGDSYRHKFTEIQHSQLSAALVKFQKARIVCRFYDHPLIRRLYDESCGWAWHYIGGRDQHNDIKPEYVIVRNT